MQVLMRSKSRMRQRTAPKRRVIGRKSVTISVKTLPLVAVMWRTSDDNAEGEVIARVFLTKKGDVVIDYINAIARTDVLAQESIKETVKELREQLFDGEVRDK